MLRKASNKRKGNWVVEDRTNGGEGTLKGMALFANSWITYSYDGLSRLSQWHVGKIYGYDASKLCRLCGWEKSGMAYRRRNLLHFRL